MNLYFGVFYACPLPNVEVEHSEFC